MNSIESFFSCYENTIAAIGAISTFAAVVVALYLAQKSEKIRLSATASIWVVVGIGDQKVRSVQVRIVNVGLRTAFIPELFFHYKVPFDKSNMLILPPQNTAAIELLPGRSVLLKVQSLEQFHSGMEKSLRKHIRWFRRLRIRNLKSFILTEGNDVFPVKLEAALKKEINALAERLAKDDTVKEPASRRYSEI